MKISTIRSQLLKTSMINSLGIYLLGTFLIKAISLITTPIFTRILSTTDYGIISIYQTWVSIFAVFIGLQMSSTIATARVHLPRDSFSTYLKSILMLSFLSFIIISAFCILFSEPLANLLELQVKLIPYLLLNAYGTSCAIFFISFAIQTKQPKKQLFFSIINVTGITILSLVLILSLKNDKYMGRIIGATVINVLTSVFVYVQLFFPNKSKIRLEDWKYALPLGLPLIIHLISNLVVGQSDRILINKFLGYQSAAIYSVAYTIGTLGLMIAEATNNVWSPWYLDNTKASSHEKINKISKLYIFTISFIFICIILSSPEILLLMAPKEYSSGLASLIIVAASIFFQFLYRFPLGYEQYSRNMKWVAVSTIASAILNLILNYYFIPLFGIVGSAYATFISYIVLFLLHEIIARKIIKGYNIKFTNYIPSIIIIITIAYLSFLFLKMWYVRYLILFLILVIYSFKVRRLVKIGTLKVI